MKMNKNWLRKAMQWSVLVLIIVFALIAKFSKNFTVDFEAYCPFGGLQALGSYLLNNALSCTMTGTQIIMGITLIIAVILLSKLFCSYICPIGTISEWLGKIGRKGKNQMTIKGIADKALRLLKYALLFLVLYHTLQSNELFCKKFDPYYGITSGFDSDVVLLYSIMAIVIVVFGSIFIRLFWCKYLCPLGAISNIFKFTGFFAVVMAAYLLLLKFGVQISYVWPLAAACIGGYFIEITRLHGKVFPVVKVNRNVESCINCGLCSKRCHQNIDVAHLQVVKDADCNLCGDCVSTCPEPNTLTFNKKKNLRYLPHIATVILVVAGIFFGKTLHIPTIDQKWVDFSQYENVKTYSRSDLSSIKCYGSSSAFANKMRKIKGVLGVATYVDTHTAEVYYNGDEISEETIDRAIFTPQKFVIRTLGKEETGVTKVAVTLEDFFDKNDFNYLARFLQDNTNAVGLVSEYACPVIVDVFFPASKKLNNEELVELLETESFTYTYKEKEYSADMGYEVVTGPELSQMDKSTYIKTMFVPVDYSFNNYATYTQDVLDSLMVKSPINNKNRSRVKYLVSHLSGNDGIVAFQSLLNEEDKEQVKITYVDTLTTMEDVTQTLQIDSLTFSYRDGRTGKIPNIFKFEVEESQQ